MQCSYLERRTCGVVCVRHNLYRLFEHNPECSISSVGEEVGLIRSQDAPGASVDQLDENLVFKGTVDAAIETKANDENSAIDYEPYLV